VSERSSWYVDHGSSLTAGLSQQQYSQGTAKSVRNSATVSAAFGRCQGDSGSGSSQSQVCLKLCLTSRARVGRVVHHSAISILIHSLQSCTPCLGIMRDNSCRTLVSSCVRDTPHSRHKRESERGSRCLDFLVVGITAAEPYCSAAAQGDGYTLYHEYPNLKSRYQASGSEIVIFSLVEATARVER